MRNKTNCYIEGLSYELPHPFRKDSERMKEQFESEAFVDGKGIVRWKSNNSFPPQDVLDFWEHLKKPFNLKETLATKELEDEMFLENYRKRMANYTPSEEELFEMRSAFGEGETVVNVFTGKHIKL